MSLWTGLRTALWIGLWIGIWILPPLLLATPRVLAQETSSVPVEEPVTPETPETPEDTEPGQEEQPPQPGQQPAATPPAAEPVETEPGQAEPVQTAPAEPAENPVREPALNAPIAEPSQDEPADEPAQGEEGAAEEGAGEDEEGDEASTLPRTPREGFLPRLDVYFPEGELDLRVSRLINETFFEGQVKYNFVDGDITAFLRYRYYGFQRITQLAVFDSIEFTDAEKFSSGDFDRVRGLLLLLQFPHDYNHRTFALAEIDSISSNIEAFQFNNDTINNYVRLGYQVGTPGDIRSNAIVGESRARSQRLFTAVREFGPGDMGFTAAATYAFDFLNGDYDYVKLETEALKRFDVSSSTFLVGRLHGGTFATKRVVRDGPDIELEDRYSIPRAELFRLDGRENLKGLDDRRPGTEELHTTWEFFFPWFLDAHRDFVRLEWQNWYWILYSGIGTAGFDRNIYSDFDTYVPDAGIGFEASFRFRRKYRFFLSGIVAQALKGNGGVEARVSIKSYR